MANADARPARHRSRSNLVFWLHKHIVSSKIGNLSPLIYIYKHLIHLTHISLDIDHCAIFGRMQIESGRAESNQRRIRSTHHVNK